MNFTVIKTDVNAACISKIAGALVLTNTAKVESRLASYVANVKLLATLRHNLCGY